MAIRAPDAANKTKEMLKNCKAIGLESRAEPRRLRQEVEGGGEELCVCPLTYLRGNYLSRMASWWPLSLFEAT